MNPLLAEAKDPYGRPRFYPYDKHPATYRLRMMRDRIEAVRRQGGNKPNVLLALLETERKIAQVEVGEFEAKLRYLESRIP